MLICQNKLITAFAKVIFFLEGKDEKNNSAVSFLLLPAMTNAGFFSSVFGGITANAITGSGKRGGSVYVNKINQRMNSVNSYLWHMHKTKKYEPSYKFYLSWLENQLEVSGYQDINKLDTIAQVYNDHGQKEKAIEVFETQIMPWIFIRYKNDRRGKK